MTSGGARVRSGPAAGPDSLRRSRPSDQATWRNLPASGREGPLPEWPLTRASTRERALWERIWSRPQAIMWEELGLFDEVALHVRTLAVAERPKAPIDARRLVQQQANSLGLTIAGLHGNRWRIVGNGSAATSTGEAAPASEDDAESARDRFLLVVGGQA